MGKAKDLTGRRYARLTVIERRGSDKHGKALWLCKCECGNEIIVRGDNLRSENTMSCGCYNRDKIKEQWKDEEFKQMMSEKSSKRMREMVKEQWKDEEFRQMQIDKMSGESHPNWKGGITPISDHLRRLPIVKQWKYNVRIKENNKCQLTGKQVHGGNSDVHHLYGFNMIVLDAHNTHNIQIKEQVKDYTEEELKLLEDYVAEWHKDSSNGILLSDEVHYLFHYCKDEDGNVLYGKGDNTPEQFEEFKERFLKGEFDDLLGDDLNV